MSMKCMTFVLAVLLCAVLAPSAMADADILRKPSPLSDSLRAKIHAAGADGVKVSEELLDTMCPGYQTPGVSANGCIVAPSGCTANFIWSDGPDGWRTQPYIGTASHCSEKNGEVVIMQVDTTTLAKVGTVVKQTADEVPGDDFALIKIDPDVAAKWGVNPALPTGGPQGIYTGCEANAVKLYGHGYGVLVGQGKPEVGLAPFWYREGYGWYGPGLPGDSGSGVTLVDNRSAGNFTHIVLFDPDLFYTPGTLTGMRTPAILEFLGPKFHQVNADGTTERSGPAPCESSLDSGSGSGGGKGDDKDNGGGNNGNGKGDNGKGSGNGKGGGNGKGAKRR